MFGRRVMSSCPIPPSMYARLGINSAQQANRVLPAMVPISSLLSRAALGSAGIAALIGGNELVPADLLSPTNLLASLGISPTALLSTINMSPLMLRMISDTMCRYSVIIPHGDTC